MRSMAANPTGIVRMLRMAAAAPGPRCARAAVLAAANADPSDVAAHLSDPAPTALLDADTTLDLWGGPRGHYVRGVAAVMLCADDAARAVIAEKDRRKHVLAAVKVHQRQATPVQVPSALVKAVAGSANLDDAHAAELVGVDRELDLHLALRPDLTRRPTLLHALLGTGQNGNRSSFTGARAVTQRDDFADLARTHRFVADLLLANHRYQLGRAVAALTDLPYAVYAQLADSQPGSTLGRSEWRALAQNPSVPSHLLEQAPADAGQMRVLARLLAARAGDDPAVYTVALQLLGSSAELTAGEVADAACAITTPAANAG